MLIDPSASKSDGTVTPALGRSLWKPAPISSFDAWGIARKTDYVSPVMLPDAERDQKPGRVQSGSNVCHCRRRPQRAQRVLGRKSIKRVRIPGEARRYLRQSSMTPVSELVSRRGAICWGVRRLDTALSLLRRNGHPRPTPSQIRWFWRAGADARSRKLIQGPMQGNPSLA